MRENRRKRMSALATREPDLLRASEVAQILGCDVQTVQRLVDSGEFRLIRFSAKGWRRIPREDVERLISGSAR
jgi:excisionase family DNA binding protein